MLHGVVYLCPSKGNFLNIHLIVYSYESLVPKWIIGRCDFNPVGFFVVCPGALCSGCSIL